MASDRAIAEQHHLQGESTCSAGLHDSQGMQASTQDGSDTDKIAQVPRKSEQTSKPAAGSVSYWLAFHGGLRRTGSSCRAAASLPCTELFDLGLSKAIGSLVDRSSNWLTCQRRGLLRPCQELSAWHRCLLA